MARPKKFDRDEALQKAIQVFWARGYEATSMTELRTALGIGRQSLYDTFGDKDQLFEEALRRYIAMGDGFVEQQLGSDAGLADIRAYFQLSIDTVTQGEPRLGCLMVNTCVERAPHDERAARLTQAGMASNRAAFEQALGNCRDKGEIPADTNVETTASFLMSQQIGIAVLARTGASREELEGIADRVLAALAAS